MRAIGLVLLACLCLPLWAEEAGEEWLPFGRGIPVLLYHGILKKEDRSEIYMISKNSFYAHMAALKLAGYTTINTHDLLAYFQNKKKLPKKTILITFDDGERSSYYYSDAALKEFGFQAVMFVIPLMQENQYQLYLSWEELNVMHRSGRWDIQAHGYKYHNLIILDDKDTKGDFASNLMWLSDQKRMETIPEYSRRLVADLHKQIHLIETKVPGSQVIAFAFPFGDYGDSAQNLDSALASAENVTAVNSVFPLSFGTVFFETDQYRVSTTPHLIYRFMDNENLSPSELIGFLERLDAKVEE